MFFCFCMATETWRQTQNATDPIGGTKRDGGTPKYGEACLRGQAINTKHNANAGDMDQPGQG